MLLLLLLNLSRNGEYQASLPPSKKACSQSILKTQLAKMSNFPRSDPGSTLALLLLVLFEEMEMSDTNVSQPSKYQEFQLQKQVLIFASRFF